MSDNINIEELRERLDYDEKTGKFTWRYCHSMPQAWIGRWAGKPAFTYVDKSGYVLATFNHVNLRAHRVAFAMVHGYWPEIVDHINGNRADNRIVNLRAITGSQNQINKTLPANHPTGVAGVTKLKSGKWKAEIKYKNRRHYLGTYSSFDEAVNARKKAEEKHGFNNFTRT